MNRTAQLLQRWQDGCITEAEFLELKDILSTSAGRRELVQDFETIAAITEEFKKAEAASNNALTEIDFSSAGGDLPPFRREAVKGDQLADLIPKPRWFQVVPAWIRQRPQLAAAALIIASISIAGAAFFWRTDSWQAKLVRTKGSVELIRDNQASPAATGQMLGKGDVIRTAHGAEAVIQYEKESTFFALKEDSLARIDERNGGKHVELMHGNLDAEVAPQPWRQPMTVTTPQAKTTLLGTRISLRAATGVTRLDVIEGLVRMNGPGGKEAIEVSTAHSAEADTFRELRSVAKEVIVVNFGPEGIELPSGALNDSGLEFSQSRGYGWDGPKEGGVIPGEFTEFRGRLTPAPRGRNAGVRIAQMGRTDALHASHVQAGWLNYTQNWKMRLAPGQYLVTVCAGDTESPQGPLHVNLQGQQVIDHVFTKAGEFAQIQDIPVEVGDDGFLRLVVGGHQGKERMPDGSSDTTINFLIVKRVGTPNPPAQAAN